MLRFIGFYDYTVILTYLSLLSAVTGMVQASRGAFGAAILCRVISGICDMFDGIVARSKKNRTDDEKAFGIQIDSLCDVISFGVFPALLCYFMGASRWIGCIVIALYALCAVIRLGFFNVLESNRQKTEGGCNKSYRGLPVTTISFIYPLVYLIGLALPHRLFMAILHVMMASVALLFVLDISVPKPDWIRILTGKKKRDEKETATICK